MSAPTEVNIDTASRTVRITTLDGHPLRGVNQFIFNETAMAKAQDIEVPGAMDPIKRQHQIRAEAHATIADQLYALVSRWRFRLAGMTCDGVCSIYR